MAFGERISYYVDLNDCQLFVSKINTQGDSDVISFRIYANRFLAPSCM